MNNEINNEQILRDFLVYSYFGIVPEHIYDKNSFKKLSADDYNTYCTKRAIMKAYEDATNEGAYNTLFKKTIEAGKLKQLKSASERARNYSAEFLFSQIQKLSALASNYEEWHKNTCDELYKKYSEVYLNENEPFFTYGNAQKWVNMAMKYLWLLGLLDNTVDCEKLHIPIDSFIIDTMWSENCVELPLKCGKKRERNYTKPSDHVIGWSQWNNKMYEDFRKNLPEKYSLCWENDAWIEQAEKRKKADLKKQYEKFFK